MTTKKTNKLAVKVDVSLQAQVNDQLMEQGVFTPLELLIANGRLSYMDYERWCRGEIEYLDEVLRGNQKKIQEQLSLAVAYALSLGLISEPRTFDLWSTADQEGQSSDNHTATQLCISRNEALVELLGQKFIHQQDHPQLDMFFDSQVVVVLNKLNGALTGQLVLEAESLLAQLYHESPNHDDLADYDLLVASLQRYANGIGDGTGNSAEALSVLKRLRGISKKLLGVQWRAYLVPLWRRLSAALEGQSFQEVHADLHVSYVLGEAEDWAGVMEAILKEPDWYQHIILCTRLARAAYLCDDQAQSLSAWFQLCWRFPDQAADYLENESQLDRGLINRWQAFLECEETLELDDLPSAVLFPAWCLLNEFGLVHILLADLAENLGVEAEANQYHLCHRLVKARLARADTEEMDLRKALLEGRTLLFKYYLSRLSA